MWAWMWMCLQASVLDFWFASVFVRGKFLLGLGLGQENDR